MSRPRTEAPAASTAAGTDMPSHEHDADAAPDVEYGGSGRKRWIVLAVVAPIVVVGALLVGRALRDDGAERALRIDDAAGQDAYDHEYTIPLGTADRIAAGEQIEIVPAELVVTVGESIRIVNEDDQDHYVGVFFVAAGETLTQRFASAGVLEDLCTVHPSGSFRLRVVDA